MRSDPVTWTVPVAVDELQEEGLRVAIDANDAERAAIASLAGVRDLPKLAAEFELTPLGGGEVKLDGHLSALVGQTCIVTLEPLQNQIEEDISLIFAPASSIRDASSDDGKAENEGEPPEAIVDGKIDLARIAIEFLLLGIDPYPRKPDALFEPVHTAADPADHPFAGLAALKRQDSGTTPPKPRRKG